MKQLLCVVLFLLLGAQSAFALSLREAKVQGLVGERKDGYVGYVVKPASGDVKSLVKTVNGQRKSKFLATAKRNKITAEAVAHRFHERAIKASAKGHYYQNSGGGWIKK